MNGIGRLDVKRLQMLREAARTGSFAAAGQVLSYTPSAVSQQMAALERDVGAILFERNGRGVALTVAGRALLGHAEVILDQLAEAHAELSAIAGLRGGELRLGSFTSATAVFVADAVEAFRQRYPNVELLFADGEPFESLARLRAAELDLAVIFDFDQWRAGLNYEGAPIASENGMELIPLFDDPFLVICPKDHPLARSAEVDLEQLASEPILAGPPWARDLTGACREAGFEPRIDCSHRATGFEAFQTFVAAGRGITLMPALALGWKRGSLAALRLIGNPVVRRVKLAVPARTSGSRATEAMAQILRESAHAQLSLGHVAPPATAELQGARE
jgi:DNA-binding transcriptional LysR family regulator